MTPIRKPQSIHVLEAILREHIDVAERLESSIGELECELLERLNDWREGVINIKLTAARSQMIYHITSAASALLTVNALRAQRGMEPSILTRVMEAGK